MNAPADILEAARAAHAGNRWAEARDGFLRARAAGPLSADDMAALADAAWWEGAIEESLSAYEEAYRLYVHGDDPRPRPAAMLAMDIAFSWFLRGEEAMGSGWMARAQRLLADEPSCVEHGYLASMAIDAAIAEGAFDTAIDLAREIQSQAARFGDETLLTFAMVSEGIAMIRKGDVGEGLAVLDEAMLPVVAGRLRPAYAGNIYCQLMSICTDLADLRRAQQWTDATTRWCQGFSNAVMFIGICRVHRAQLLQVRGRWSDAEVEIQRVCEELAAMNVVAVGLARYELGEVRRLRGDLAGAAEAYADAHRHGRDPQPGLALLWLAQGQHDAALEALLAAESSATDRLAKTRIWEAMVEVALAAGDLATARRASDELQAAAATYASSGLAAAAALARGIVELAEGDADAAVVSLQSARQRWQDLDAPYRVAHARRHLARAHDALGNEHTAGLEREAAAAALAGLGVAESDPAAAPPPAPELPGGLTRREAEVLALVARGLTNRDVAAALVLSEKTVARHLANIYTKLGVSSRTAAAAVAHDHGLAPRPPA